jgi:outer membrane protein
MKKINLILLTFALLAATAISATAQTKIATVDMKKVFNGYWKKKTAEASLDNRKIELRKEIKDMTDGLEKAQADYKKLMEQASDPVISSEEREKRKQAANNKAREINTSKVALEQFQRQAESQLADQTQRMSANLVTEIQKAVADKAKAGGYTLVLNSGTTEIVVYSESSTDISDAVLGQLNAGAPIDVVKPATGGIPLNIKTNLP